MPQIIYNIVQLRWTTKEGRSEWRQGNALILSKRLERLRRPATLTLLDGTVIGGCEEANGRADNPRIKWVWWYEKDSLISHTESTRAEEDIKRLKASGLTLK